MCCPQCKERREKWLQNQKKFIPLGEREHEAFTQAYEDGEAAFLESNHVGKRQFERAFPYRAVKEAVLNGWVIERQKTTGGHTRLVIMYYFRTSHKSYRPMHVVIEFDNPFLWTFITVYDPRSQAWKWDEELQKRICFCNKQ